MSVSMGLEPVVPPLPSPVAMAMSHALTVPGGVPGHQSLSPGCQDSVARPPTLPPSRLPPPPPPHVTVTDESDYDSPPVTPPTPLTPVLRSGQMEDEFTRVSRGHAYIMQ